MFYITQYSEINIVEKNGIEITKPELLFEDDSFVEAMLAYINKDKNSDFYRNVLSEMVIVNAISCVESFLDDSIEYILVNTEKGKNIVKKEKGDTKDIYYNEIFKYNSLNELHKEVAKKYINNDFSNKSFDDKWCILNEKFNINFKSLDIKKNEIIEIHQTRHIVIHNNGVVDKDYIKKVNNSKFNVGDKRTLEKKYIKKSTHKLLKLILYISKQLQKNFL